MIDTIINQYIGWLREYKQAELNHSSLNLERTAAKLNRYALAKKKKAAIGVYGQSQSGKSFLVDALLRNSSPENVADKNFKIKGLGAFKDINPEQNSELTAVTCRFSEMTEPFNSDGYYVCELLSLGELMHVLMAGFAEFKASAEMTDAISTKIKELTTGYGNLTISKGDLFDIIDHLAEIDSVASEYGSHVLSAVSEKLKNGTNSGITISDIKRIFSCLFESVPDFFKFVSETLDFYESIELQKRVLVPASLVSKFINTLEMLRWGQANVCKIKPRKEGHYYLIEESTSGFIALPVIQVCCSELILPIEAPYPDFLIHIDILDFPGIRAINPEKQVQTGSEHVILAIKQGKLKATFDLYTLRREIPALLIASSGENHEAHSLSGKLKNWVETYCTTDKSKSANDHLFIALTKADLLIKDAANWKESFERRLEQRFQNSYKFEIAQPLIEAGVTGFSNIYFTINEDFRQQDDIGSSRQDEAKQIFLSNEYVIDCLGTRADSHFESLLDAQIGTSRILNKLNSNAPNLNTYKRGLIKTASELEFSALYSSINGHLHSEDEQKEREILKNKVSAFINLIRKDDGNLLLRLYSILENLAPKEWEVSGGGTRGGIFGNRQKTNKLGNYIKNFEDNILEISTNDEDSLVLDFLRQIVVFLKKNESFKTESSAILNMHSTLPDSEVHQRLFKEIVNDYVISTLTGYSYHIDNSEDNLVVLQERLIKVVRQVYSSLDDFDPDANQNLLDIKQQLDTYVHSF
jgi:hypothetical protein